MDIHEDTPAQAKLKEIVGRYIDHACKNDGHVDVYQLSLILYPMCKCCIEKLLIAKGYQESEQTKGHYFLNTVQT